jgi:hypothetical protein
LHRYSSTGLALSLFSWKAKLASSSAREVRCRGLTHVFNRSKDGVEIEEILEPRVVDGALPAMQTFLLPLLDKYNTVVGTLVWQLDGKRMSCSQFLPESKLNDAVNDGLAEQAEKVNLSLDEVRRVTTFTASMLVPISWSPIWQTMFQTFATNQGAEEVHPNKPVFDMSDPTRNMLAQALNETVRGQHLIGVIGAWAEDIGGELLACVNCVRKIDGTYMSITRDHNIMSIDDHSFHDDTYAMKWIDQAEWLDPTATALSEVNHRSVCTAHLQSWQSENPVWSSIARRSYMLNSTVRNDGVVHVRLPMVDVSTNRAVGSLCYTVNNMALPCTNNNQYSLYSILEQLRGGETKLAHPMVEEYIFTSVSALYHNTALGDLIRKNYEFDLRTLAMLRDDSATFLGDDPHFVIGAKEAELLNSEISKLLFNIIGVVDGVDRVSALNSADRTGVFKNRSLRELPSFVPQAFVIDRRGVLIGEVFRGLDSRDDHEGKEYPGVRSELLELFNLNNILASDVIKGIRTCTPDAAVHDLHAEDEGEAHGEHKVLHGQYTHAPDGKVYFNDVNDDHGEEEHDDHGEEEHDEHGEEEHDDHGEEEHDDHGEKEHDEHGEKDDDHIDKLDDHVDEILRSFELPKHYVTVPVSDVDNSLLGVIVFVLSPPTVVAYELTSVQYVSLVSGVISLFFCILLFKFVWDHSDEPVFKVSSVPFLLVMVIGASLVLITSYFLAFLPENVGWCWTRQYLAPLAFLMMHCPLLLKTYRLFSIFRLLKKKALLRNQTTRLTNLNVLVGLGGIFAVQIAIFVVGALAGEVPEFSHQLTEREGFILESLSICHEQPLTAGLSYAFQMLLVVYALALAWKSWFLPLQFKESSAIFVSMMFVVFYGIVIIPLQYFVVLDPSNMSLLRGIGVHIGVMLFLCPLFLPKIIAVTECCGQWSTHTSDSSGSPTRRTPTGTQSLTLAKAGSPSPTAKSKLASPVLKTGSAMAGSRWHDTGGNDVSKTVRFDDSVNQKPFDSLQKSFDSLSTSLQTHSTSMDKSKSKSLHQSKWSSSYGSRSASKIGSTNRSQATVRLHGSEEGAVRKVKKPQSNVATVTAYADFSVFSYGEKETKRERIKARKARAAQDKLIKKNMRLEKEEAMRNEKEAKKDAKKAAKERSVSSKDEDVSGAADKQILDNANV